MSKARTLGDLVSTGAVLADGTINGSEIVDLPAASPAGSTGQVQYNNAGEFGALADGTAGQVLTSAGAGAAPTWADAAGGGTIDAVATGTISNGATVVLKADGTVSVVTSSVGSPSFGSATQLLSTDVVQYRTAYGNNHVALVYVGASSYPYMIIGFVSGSSITFGSQYMLNNFPVDDPDVVYHAGEDIFALSYRDTNQNYVKISSVKLVGGSVSVAGGTSIVDSGFDLRDPAIGYNAAVQRVVICCRNNSASARGYYFLYSFTGTSNTKITSGAYTAGGAETKDITYDPTSGLNYVAYRNGGDLNRVYVCPLTVAASSVTPGTETVVDTDSAILDRRYAASLTVDTVNNRLFIAYKLASDATKAYMKAAVAGSTSPTFGTRAEFTDSASAEIVDCSYDATAQKVAVFCETGVAVATLNSSNTNISVSGVTSYGSPTAALDQRLSSVYVPPLAQTFVYFRASATNYPNVARGVISPITSDANTWLGIAAEAIASGATGAVTIVGGVNESQTGLTIGSTYYVNYDGTLTTTATNYGKIGRAISSTKLLITEGNA